MKKEYEFPKDLFDENQKKEKTMEDTSNETDRVSRIRGMKKLRNPALIIGLILLFIGCVFLLSGKSKQTSIQVGEYKGIEVVEGDNMEVELWISFIEMVSIEKGNADDLQEIKDRTSEKIHLQAGNYGVSLEDYITSMSMDMDSYELYIEKSAQQEYLQQLATIYVAEAENLIPTDAEYEKLIESYVQRLGYIDFAKAEEKGYTYAEFEQMILRDIVKSWLLAHAVIVTE